MRRRWGWEWAAPSPMSPSASSGLAETRCGAGRAGTGSPGTLVRREMRAEDVTVRAVEDSGAPTGLMLKERRTVATQKVSYYRAGSAGSRLSP